MAGYYLHSLDWAALHELVDSPSTQLIQNFTRLFSKRLEPIKENLSEAYLMFGWPSQIDELADVVESHFKTSNWYDDLSSDEGDAWESTLMELVGIDLEELDLSRNRFACIPECISRLTNLRVLRLHSNQLTTLPGFLARMQLKTLRVDENQLLPPFDVLNDQQVLTADVRELIAKHT